MKNVKPNGKVFAMGTRAKPLLNNQLRKKPDIIFIGTLILSITKVSPLVSKIVDNGFPKVVGEFLSL